MKIKDLISNATMLKIAVALIASVIVVLLLMKSDHQNFSYELNQPWRYPLLTAEFDTPIMRDSVSAQHMRDSIDKAFVPFVWSCSSFTKVKVISFSSQIVDNQEIDFNVK